MKTLFLFLILNCSFLIGTANAQWWVRGGNLLWPYGNVDIAKDLTVSGETTLDSNTTIDGNLDVTGDFTLTGDLVVTGNISENGIKEYIAHIVWNTNSDPTVTEIKNTTGDTFTWDNVSDVGERIDITATGSVFSENKTSFVSIFSNSASVAYYILGQRTADDTYRLESFTSNGGGLQAVPDIPFFIEIKIYP
ncbi:MAG: hypothetical protein IH618_15710 [Ignavibacteriaceae bacterium]|nr:hypothetical protein [Ignavibacteriaceae bacterium]